MALCAQRCKSLLFAALSSGTRSSRTVPAAVAGQVSSKCTGNGTVSSNCTRAICSTSSSCDNRSHPGHVCVTQYRNPHVITYNFSRHYSDESYPEEDFSRGYGGPVRSPVIDWRDRHVIDYKTFAKLVDNRRNIQLIDVREPFELTSAGCIDNSLNIPFVHFRTAMMLNPHEFKEKYGANMPHKEDDNVVLMDLRGNRSEGALRISHELGFTKVKRFPGGFREWSDKNNLPRPPTYYEHGVPRDHWTNLKYDDLRMMIKRDHVHVIDVREPWEVVEEGSITNALNIPVGYLEFALNMNEEDFQKQYGVTKPRKIDDIGFISWKGLRSAGCQLLAQELGYTKACNFLGGQQLYNDKRAQRMRPGYKSRLARTQDV